MRLARSLLLVALAAACGGSDETKPDAAAAATVPTFEGRPLAAWRAELEAPATCRAAAAALARRAASDPEEIDVLARALGNADGGVRRAAADALAGLGEPAVGTVAARLGAADARAAQAAGDVLASMGSSGLRRLVVLLGDPAPTTSAAASAALLRAGRPAVEPLADGLKFGSDKIRAPAVNCLARLGAATELVAALADPSTRDAATDALRSMDADVLVAARDATSEPKLRAAVDEVIATARGRRAKEFVTALGSAPAREKSAAALAALGDAALPALVTGVTDGPDAVRAACADLLAARGASCIAPVTPLLVHRTAAVRDAAARVLVGCGAEGLQALTGALGGDDAGARDAAAAAMRDVPAGLAALVDTLAAGSPSARTAAVGAVVAAGASAVPALEEVALYGDASRQTAAIDCLSDIGAPAFGALQRLLAAPSRTLRESAGDALARAGAPAVPALVTALASDDTSAQASAARALVRIGAPALAPLVEASRGADAALAARARDVLVRLGPASVAEFARMAASSDSAARVEALRALGRLAADVDEAVPPLAAALDDADPSIRAEAARGLAAAGPRAKSAAAALDKAMRDKAPQVRIEAAVAVYRGGASATAMPFLVGGLKEKEPAMRVLAADAIVRSGIPSAQSGPPLTEALKDPDASVRIAAMRALVAVGAKGDAVVEAIARCARSADAEERAEAVAAIPRLTDVPVAEVLRVGGPMRGDRVRRAKAREAGSSPQVDKAVTAALDWLARHQSPDGRWDGDGFDEACKLNRCDGPGSPGFDPGVTGLALLAFLGAGETQSYGPHKDAVARGLAWLRGVQDAEGCIGPRSAGARYKHGEGAGNVFPGRPQATYITESDGWTYNHAIATVALCEDFMLTADPEVGRAAQNAVKFALAAKNPYLAWRYGFPPDGDNDTSVTGWMCWGLATARAAGLDVELTALKDGVSWVEKMTEPEFGRTGYQQRGGPPARTDRMADSFPADKSESLTGVGVMIRLLAGHTTKDDEFIAKGWDLIVKKLPRWDVGAGTIDFCHWFWGSAALRQAGNEHGGHWKRWAEAMKAATLANQRVEPDRDERGSWDPVDCWRDQGGRVYATAMCCMCLESFWRTNRLWEGK